MREGVLMGEGRKEGSRLREGSAVLLFFASSVSGFTITAFCWLVLISELLRYV